MISEIKLKSQVCEIGKRIYEKGFVASNDGNISVRIDEDTFLVTPTGVSKGFMTPEMLIKVDGDGNLLEGERKPTSEIKMHLRVYKERPEIKSVVHVHPPYATAFAIAGVPLDQATMPESIVTLGTIPIAEYGTPSTDELASAISPFILNHNGALLENHGALTWGENLDQAYFLMESLEFCAKVNWIARQMNGDRELNTTNVDRLLEIKRHLGKESASPSGVQTASNAHAEKITPPLERSLTAKDIDLIVEKVTQAVVKLLK
ncbi:class II aldolase/adducin family protein [Pseudoneobacillus rhizosphaerae]|uniref:Methylthioribulose-1-phosphate dehydratase n=1 Tax=Pseudoneobacillus rhizosphaerae TaxID=2880968 RepID=A0A9C7G607_9BACI|nr:class II aldolase/adducin family protein [Pseudoneobacillus rhizosphaerae]CAG9606419.1 Methylthioribulose-1-phosphate dehydratase [Pseudoneobacillus rhizosphaerae]